MRLRLIPRKQRAGGPRSCSIQGLSPCRQRQWGPPGHPTRSPPQSPFLISPGFLQCGCSLPGVCAPRCCGDAASVTPVPLLHKQHPAVALRAVGSSRCQDTQQELSHVAALALGSMFRQGRRIPGSWQHRGSPARDSTVPWIANGAEMWGCGNNQFPAGREECSGLGGLARRSQSRAQESCPCAQTGPGEHSQPPAPPGPVPEDNAWPAAPLSPGRCPGCVTSRLHGARWPCGAARPQPHGTMPVCSLRAGATAQGCPCEPGQPITLGSQHLLLGTVGSCEAVPGQLGAITAPP